MKILYCDGADSSFGERLGAFFLPFDIAPLPRDSAPADGDLALVPFSGAVGAADWDVGTLPFIGYGPASEIGNAFACGALEFLCLPFNREELIVRVERVFGSLRRSSRSCGLSLEGTRLVGSRGCVCLGSEEIELLRLLMAESPGPVSRVALRRFLWPNLVNGSRVVDESISRIRRKMALVSDSSHCPQIRSIRGFGYVLDCAERL